MSLRSILSSLVLATLASLPAAAQSFVAFESGPVRPLALSPSRALLFAANIPDNRVEIFRATDAGLERAGEAVVGLEPVAIAARSETEIYVVNHLSDSVSVLDVTDPAKPFVKATLLVGDEPRDVVIAGPARDRVYVTAAHRGQNRPGDAQLTTPGVGRADVWVFDAGNLDQAPRIVTLFCDTPRGLAVSPDGTRVYAAAFHSGNRTTVLDELAVTANGLFGAAINDGFSAPGMPAPTASTAGVPAPKAGVILKHDGSKWRDSAGRDWTPRTRFNLPDHDLFELDATVDPPAIVRRVGGVGTVLFNVVVHPQDGRVYVSNLESRNHVRFEPTLRGHIAENRITVIDGSTLTPVHLNPHIDFAVPSGPDEEIEQSLAFPLALEIAADGETLYAAAFGSGKVAVMTDGAVVTARIDVGRGPCGLALDEGRARLYVLNRFDQTVSIVDTASRSQTAAVPLRYDPEPPHVRAGRPVLYDARRSGHGDSACASCHIFGDFDSLAWDLGDPAGTVESNPLIVVSVQAGPLTSFHPMKGPMTTQSLRGMAGAGAMHWRGDRNGGVSDPYNEEKAFLAFRPAFQGLLGMDEELPLDEMQKFGAFMLEVHYPPSPIANLDGTLTAQQAAGKQIFDSNGSRSGLGGDSDPCDSCHTMPLGTDGHASFEGLTQDFKVAHMRNLYQKIGMFGTAVPAIANESPFTLATAPTAHLGDQVRGFGFLHDGSIPTLFNFFRMPTRQFTFPNQAGRSGDQKVRELESFLLAFPTGLAPVVGQQITLHAGNVDLPASPAVARYNLLRARAAVGDCDLVAHGFAGGRLRGYAYRSGGLFDTDQGGETATEGELLALVRVPGAALTFTAVPLGSGARIGIDRDEDGWRDRDELESGSDPADPMSVPCPLTPTSLTAVAGPSSAELTWTDAGTASCPTDGYNVYRADDGGPWQLRSAAPLLVTAFTDTGLASGVHAYRVTALRAGDESAPSASVEVVIDAAIRFQRGNCNQDGALDLSDPIFSLSYLFSEGETPGCEPACDANGDGAVDISDAVYTLLFLFGGGGAPGAYPACESTAATCAADPACG